MHWQMAPDPSEPSPHRWSRSSRHSPAQGASNSMTSHAVGACLAALAAALTCAGCSSSATPHESEAVVVVRSSSSFVEPGHETVVRRDGSVTSGSEEVRISAAAVDQIEAAFDKAGFKSLRPLYAGGTTDAPTYSVTFRGRTVRFGTGAAPPRLWAAVSQVEEIADEARARIAARVTVTSRPYLDVKLKRDGTAQIGDGTSDRTVRPVEACVSRMLEATA